jgi:O-6-methylguanine DNA methyltransferase
MKSFTEKVLAVVSKIPKGSVMTYKQVAEKAGSLNASRAVGSIMKKNYDPKIPCHRVIPSSRNIAEGKLFVIKNVGEYNRGREEKIKKLKSEGFKFI